MEKDKLPDKPSELIRLALADLEWCEDNEDYRINMDTWHRFEGMETPMGEDNEHCCEVCMAGAIMAHTLELPRTTDARPGDFINENTQRKLVAIDNLRSGSVKTALECMGIENDAALEAIMHDPELSLSPPSARRVCIPEYCYCDRDKFDEAMHRLADILEQHDL